MKKIVIDPTESGECYGKYELPKSAIPDNWSDAVEVDELDNYNVVEWRHEGQ